MALLLPTLLPSVVSSVAARFIRPGVDRIVFDGVEMDVLFRSEPRPEGDENMGMVLIDARSEEYGIETFWVHGATMVELAD